MNKDDPIEITQVGNGFLVRRPHNIVRGDCVPFTEMLVFRTLAELQHWLGGHFTHRARPNFPDAEKAA